MVKRIFWVFGALLALLALLLVVVLLVLPINLAAISNVAFGYSVEAPSEATVASRFKVPEGFSVGLYAEGLKKVRLMAFSQAGDLVASQPREGKVVLLQRDSNADGQADGQRVLLKGLNAPHGLEFYQQWLYVAEKDAVGRVAFDHKTGQLAGEYQRLIEGLPSEGNHWSKTIRIHNERLFVSIGSTCNVCIEADKRRATIMAFDTDGRNGQIYADGLRNSVGLDFAPWDDSLYATDNGRDLLGDDYPVCELNKIESEGFYGWPFINGFGDLDPDFGVGQEPRLANDVEPVFGFKAHNAPLGMRFIRTATMPQGYERSALVALHGSWNRSQPDGYKVIALHWQEDGSIKSEDFFTGFEVDGDIIGRPVDIVEGPDQCLYVSDDFAGSIYRVCYGQAQAKIVSEPKSTEVITAPILTELEQLRLSQQGSELYQKHNCQSCHLLNGEGLRGGKAIKGLSKRYSSVELADYFLLPNPPMPTYSLTERERKALAVYLLAAH